MYGYLKKSDSEQAILLQTVSMEIEIPHVPVSKLMNVTIEVKSVVKHAPI